MTRITGNSPLESYRSFPQSRFTNDLAKPSCGGRRCCCPRLTAAVHTRPSLTSTPQSPSSKLGGPTVNIHGKVVVDVHAKAALVQAWRPAVDVHAWPPPLAPRCCLAPTTVALFLACLAIC